MEFYKKEYIFNDKNENVITFDHCLMENDVEINSEQCSFGLLFFLNIDLFL